LPEAGSDAGLEPGGAKRPLDVVEGLPLALGTGCAAFELVGGEALDVRAEIRL